MTRNPFDHEIFLPGLKKMDNPVIETSLWEGQSGFPYMSGGAAAKATMKD